MSSLCFTKYYESGYSVIPVTTHNAAPFEQNWARWAVERQPAALIEEYEKNYSLPNHGAGLVLGPASGIVAIDIDSESKDILDLCPPSPVSKRGSKGETRFYRPGPGLANVNLKRPNVGPNQEQEKQEGVEIMVNGRQTVMPPSINRKTKKPYFWLTPDSLLDVKPEELPILTVEMVEKLRAHICGATEFSSSTGGGIGGSGIQGAAGRNDGLTKVVWAMLNEAPGRSDHDIATELVGVDVREYGANAYFSDPKEMWSKKGKGVPFNAALAFVKHHRKQLAKKGTPNPRKTVLNMNPTVLGVGSSVATAPTQPGDTVVDMTRYAMWEKLGLEVSGNNPKTTIDSARKLLSGVPQLSSAIWFDSFYNNVMTSLPRIGGGDPIPQWGRPWEDVDDLYLMVYAQSQVGLDIGKETTRSAVDFYARQHTKHAVRDWLKALPAWDMEPRLGTFMSKYLGAEQNAYTASAGTNFLVSLIARVMRPGCKADCMPILEGQQGLLKSTALRVLAGDHWFGELTNDLDDKDALISLQGRWLIEIPELDSILKADPKTVKRLLSTQSDRFRAPYDRRAGDHPRQFIFAGTTNEADYLKDPTGGRRFWPIACSKVDIEALAQDREQLFAEALLAFQQGLPWWEMPESAKAEVAARTEIDAWYDEIAEWLAQPPQATKKITSSLIAFEVLKLDIERVDQRVKNRIANCMKMLGYINSPEWCSARKTMIRIWKGA